MTTKYVIIGGSSDSGGGDGGSSFTAGGDLSGDETSQEVISLTGTDGVVTGPTLNLSGNLNFNTNSTDGYIRIPYLPELATVISGKLNTTSTSYPILTQSHNTLVWGHENFLSTLKGVHNVVNASNTNYLVSGGKYTYNASAGGLQLFSSLQDLGGGTGVVGIKEATVNPSTNPTDGIILYVDAADGYAKYRHQDGSIITINAASGGSPTGSAGGDLTGTYPNPEIGEGVITDEHIDDAAAIAYSKLNLSGSIVNADVGAAAAIAGTKISPDFGSQNITTTGVLTLGSSASTDGKIRLPYNGGSAVTLIGAKDSGGTDRKLLTFGAGNALTLNDSSRALNTTIHGATLTVTANTISINAGAGHWTLSDFATNTLLQVNTSTKTFTNNNTAAVAGGNARCKVYSNVASVQTSDDTETSLFTWTITDECTTLVTAEVLAINSDGSKTASIVVRAKIKRDGGTVTVGTVEEVFSDEDASFDLAVDIDEDSGTGRIRVTGIAATTIDWGGVVTRLELTHA